MSKEEPGVETGGDAFVLSVLLAIIGRQSMHAASVGALRAPFHFFSRTYAVP